jgi:hypothetical protein
MRLRTKTPLASIPQLVRQSGAGCRSTCPPFPSLCRNGSPPALLSKR